MPDNFGRMISSEAPKKLQDFCYPKRKPRRKQKGTDIVFHIRKPLKKQRGSQFYYDYSDRNQGTYCGAPETAFDISHKGLATSWTNKQAHYVPCKECSKIRAFGGVK